MTALTVTREKGKIILSDEDGHYILTAPQAARLGRSLVKESRSLRRMFQFRRRKRRADKK